MENIGWILLGLLAVQVVFQAKLALGAPLGHIAYGGRHKGTLPNVYRVISAVAVIVYSFFMTVVVMASTTDNGTNSNSLVEIILWVMVAFFGLGTIANAISPSKPERWWAVYTLATLICTLSLLASIS